MVGPSSTQQPLNRVDWIGSATLAGLRSIDGNGANGRSVVEHGSRRAVAPSIAAPRRRHPGDRVARRPGVTHAWPVYLLAVVAVGMRWGTVPAVVTSLAAFLAYDFLFVQPLYTFTINSPEEWLNLLLLLAVAVAIGRLVAIQADAPRSWPSGRARRRRSSGSAGPWRKPAPSKRPRPSC